tara:strand:- start:196 stop:378 length:183 start_codon:yes stop_codon:yes gene_type:complete
MTYDQLKNQVDKILEQAESEMESMIEKFNENNEEGTQIDTVDLSSKFSELYEYVEDYSDE